MHTIDNPAPRDRVIIRLGYEAGVSCYMPQWRASAPGHSTTTHAVGDPWARFLALWHAVACALSRWDSRGRPGPVFSHLTPSDQAFIAASHANR